jgi:hypothetical protein
MKYDNNETTGKIVELLENGDTREVKVTYKREPIKGGFKLMYNERDYVLKKTAGSELQHDIFFYIEAKLHSEEKTKLSPSKIAKELKTAREVVSRMMTNMVKYNAMLETDSGRYMWNPFVSLPTFKDGKMLQDEWNDTIEAGKFKRRGKNLLDEYYQYKINNKEPGLTFSDYIKNVNPEGKIEQAVLKGE